MPVHIAMVMDGNGRWAEQRGLPKYKGHEAGMEAMIRIVRHASDIGVKHLTVYAFSTENWKRAEDEVAGIFRLLIIYVERELAELHRNNVRVDIIGDQGPFSPAVKRALSRMTEKTRGNTGLRFHIALNYGGRQEILAAARALAGQGALDAGDADLFAGQGAKLTENTLPLTNNMPADNVGAGQAASSADNATADNAGAGQPASLSDEDAFAGLLYTAGVPDPDLFVRPGGEKRVSNFLLWQIAYSELVFSDVLWPDFGPDDLDAAVAEFAARKRRFGGR